MTQIKAALEYAVTSQQECNKKQLEADKTLPGQTPWMLLIETLKAAWRDEDSRC